MLEFLLRNKNRVLTRTVIIEHVWDLSYDPMTNIVDAHIRALRQDRPQLFTPAHHHRAGRRLHVGGSGRKDMTSLRNLISRFALMLMAWLVGFSALVYLASETLLHRFVDGRLLALTDTLAEIIDHHPDILDTARQSQASSANITPGVRDQQEIHGVLHFLRVFSPDGRLLWKSPNASPLPLISPAMLNRVLIERTVYETVALPDGMPSRRLFVSVTREGTVCYVLQAETSLLHYQTAMSELLILLIVSSGAMLLITWLGNLWLVKKVLTPH